MPLDLRKILPTYQFYIDSIIQQMGKNIELHFNPSIQNNGSVEIDKIRPGDFKQPGFKQSVQNKPQEPNFITILGLIQDNPKEVLNFNIKIAEGKNIIKVKTFLTSLPDLQRAIYIIPHSDVAKAYGNGTKYRLLNAPIPRGLIVDRYCTTYWVSI